MMLFERVRKLAKEKDGNLTTISDRLGMLQPTFNGYLKESRQDNLWPLLPKILEIYTDISREWLYFGEGDMYKEETPPNESPNYDLGSRLRRAFTLKSIDDQDIINKTRIKPDKLKKIYNNEIFPDYHFIEILYKEFHLNPSYLMNGYGSAFEPQSELERVMFLAQYEGYISHRTLQILFDCTKEDAMEYLKDYNEYQRVLPLEWRYHFGNKLNFNPGWIANPQASMVVFSDNQSYGDTPVTPQKTA